LTIEELQSVNRKGNGCNVIFIDNHKNQAHKACRLSLKDDLLSLVEDYAKHARLLVSVEVNCNNVFTTMLEEPMNSRCMGEAIGTAWKQFEKECGKELPKINPTIIRQSIASLARDENCSAAELTSLANHMTHLEKTADRYYDSTRGQRHSEVASNMLYNFFHVAPESDDEDDLSSQRMNTNNEAEDSITSQHVNDCDEAEDDISSQHVNGGYLAEDDKSSQRLNTGDEDDENTIDSSADMFEGNFTTPIFCIQVVMFCHIL